MKAAKHPTMLRTIAIIENDPALRKSYPPVCGNVRSFYTHKEAVLCDFSDVFSTEKSSHSSLRALVLHGDFR